MSGMDGTWPLVAAIEDIGANVPVRQGVRFRVIEHFRAALASLPEPAAPPTLDAAWAEAEAALPDGWTLELGLWRAEPNRLPGRPDYEVTAGPYDWNEEQRIGKHIHRGDTPTEALQALAAALRDRRR